MKKIAFSITGLILAASAATIAHGQPASDAGAVPPPDAAQPAEPATPADPAAPSDPAADAVPPADPATPADPAAPAEPSADAGVTASTDFTDEEIDNFAEATVKVQAINADSSIAPDQKQEKMATAVAEAGLDPAKYNEIGEAAAADPELRTKIQTAMSKHAQPPQG